MIHQLARVIAALTAAAAGASVAYYLICLVSAYRFCAWRRASLRESGGTSPVSILKPLKGTDPEMYESFRSYCLQDYPEYEIIFGVSELADPAIALVERLKKEFPERNIRLIHCSENLGSNTKVSNLAQMLAQARHPILIVNDSDIRVTPDYLSRVLAPLRDPKLGLVTCLYRGIANSTLGSRLESLGISTDFCAGVLVARQLEGVKFGLGSTLAFRRDTLEMIGGFAPLADYLADDYQVGHRIAELGLQVEVSEVIVDTFLPRYTLAGFFEHQLRWARTVRDSRFWGYVGLGMTFGLPWAILPILASSGAAWSWVLLTIVAALRLAVAVTVGKMVLKDRQVLRLLPLLPLRDVFAMLVWVLSFAGHRITWRGEAFVLKNGKLAQTTR